jgi:hypothetical protein
MIDLNAQQRDLIFKRILDYACDCGVLIYDRRVGGTTPKFVTEFVMSVMDTWTGSAVLDSELSIEDNLKAWISDVDLFQAVGGTTITVVKRWKGTDADYELGFTRTIRSSDPAVVQLTVRAIESELWQAYQGASLKPQISAVDGLQVKSEDEKTTYPIDFISIELSKDKTQRVYKVHGGKWKLGITWYPDNPSFKQYKDRLAAYAVGSKIEVGGEFMMEFDGKYRKVTSCTLSGKPKVTSL